LSQPRLPRRNPNVPFRRAQISTGR